MPTKSSVQEISRWNSGPSWHTYLRDFNADRLPADLFLYVPSLKIVPTRPRKQKRAGPMSDLLMLSLAIASFAMALGYALICERL